MKKISIVAFLCMISISMLFAESPFKIGLSGSVQGNQFGIMLPMWVSNSVALVPAFEMKYAETVGMDMAVGLAIRRYHKVEDVAPYLGFRVGTAFFTPSSDNEFDKETRFDMIFGPNVGIEYFFTERFSAGVEAQGNFTKSHEKSLRFGNPGGLNFNTATMISVTVYF